MVTKSNWISSTPNPTRQYLPIKKKYLRRIELRLRMAKKQPAKLTKDSLLNEVDLMVQSLNLLRSAIKEDRSRKPEKLEEYRAHFYHILGKEK